MSSSELSPSRVLLLGASLLAIGTTGFYTLPGMLDEAAEGSRLVNSFYCSVMTLTTIGYGDICPGKLSTEGKMFLIFYAFCCLGAFCGPVMDLASTWQRQMPGGFATLASMVLALGASIFTSLEGLSQSEAIYASVVTGTTIGYGDISPSTDSGKVAIALYAILVVNVMAGLLQPARRFLESLCRTPKATTKID